MVNQESQTQDIVPICICDKAHKCPCFVSEEEINRRVKKEVDVLFQQLLKFMRDITSDYEERIKANKKLRSEVEEKKIELQEAEKLLASLKSRSG